MATQENLAPVDLIGYSMGGSTAFRFAAQHPHRVRNIALLAPALLLHGQQVIQTASAAESGKFDEIVYNYHTQEQALNMCQLVGWPAANARKLAPLLAVGREGHPREYWYGLDGNDDDDVYEHLQRVFPGPFSADTGGREGKGSVRR